MAAMSQQPTAADSEQIVLAMEGFEPLCRAVCLSAAGACEANTAFIISFTKHFAFQFCRSRF
jgi:hypothetical protein